LRVLFDFFPPLNSPTIRNFCFFLTVLVDFGGEGDLRVFVDDLDEGYEFEEVFDFDESDAEPNTNADLE